MSALGQKQTFAVQNGMSALPFKSGHWSGEECPLWATCDQRGVLRAKRLRHRVNEEA